MIGKIVQKRILFLLLIFVLSVTYSVISLDTSKDINVIEDISFKPNAGVYDEAKATDSATKKMASNIHSDTQVESVKKSATVDKVLPLEFDLVGIADITSNEQSVLIKFENDLYNYEINDFVLNSTMQLVKISALQVEILFEQVIYTKNLNPPNLLSKSSQDQDKSYEELINMTAKEISSRPRIIEHLIALTPTPYIADGKLASPGLNPALFEQAGFKSDDLLKMINGKSVTIESEFDEIKKELKTAQTLEFLVMRKGRLITLYLDIPSETLELVRD